MSIEEAVPYTPAVSSEADPYPTCLLILGASSYGELFVPRKVTSMEEALEFGEGELPGAFETVLKAGKSWAYLMRIGEGFESDAERQEALREAYRYLEDFPAHVVVPLGAKTGLGYAGDLAAFLNRHFPVGFGLGVLATPDIDPEDVKGSLAEILSAPELFGGLGAQGRALCVVASPITVGGQAIDAQVFYGALLSKLPAGVSLTNVPVPEADIPWSLDEEDWASVLEAGITAWRKRPYRGLYTSTALTLGTAPFRLQSTMRCLQAILFMMEAVADPYIGRTIGGSGQERALEQDLVDALEIAHKMGFLRSYALQLDWRRVQGEIDVILDLSLWHEINWIRLHHSIQVT